MRGGEGPGGARGAHPRSGLPGSPHPPAQPRPIRRPELTRPTLALRSAVRTAPRHPSLISLNPVRRPAHSGHLLCTVYHAGRFAHGLSIKPHFTNR